MSYRSVRLTRPGEKRFGIPTASMVGLLLLIFTCLPILAAEGDEEEEAKVWTDKADFSLVVTDGNSNSQTLGFNNTLNGKWARSTFGLRVEAIRAESSDSRIAVGDTNDFVVVEPEPRVSAERYFLGTQYGHSITGNLNWNGTATWERNQPSGIQNRYSVAAGLGNVWHDRNDLKFSTEYSVTYTDQEDVVDDSTTEDRFPGLRVFIKYEPKLGQNATYRLSVIMDEDLDDTSNFRVNMVNSITAAMGGRYALKASLQFLFDNRPALEDISLFAPPFSRGDTPIDTVTNELDKLDTIFTTSLVIDF